MLQGRYRHLKNLPLTSLVQVQPLLLIGSDYPHLVTPIEPVRLRPPGGPAAVRTRLGWALQGPAKDMKHQLTPQQCLHLSVLSPKDPLLHHVEKLWQMDILPYQSERAVTRSRQDKEAIFILKERTRRIEVKGIWRYTTPLLRKKNLPPLQAPKQAVLGHLRGTEKRLVQEPEMASVYKAEFRSW